VFIADDSLGWVYQFWQVELKDAINASEKKIGADELPAVTQLFTEDYMVQFLLHNTIGAWWAGNVLAQHPSLAVSAQSEAELRAACALDGVNWEYLRFVQENGVWSPAAGTFSGWPTSAGAITVLDPCMGSGHFLVFALPILVAVRRAEVGLSIEDAVDSVIRENLFGLEIDARCTQIAAFNLAFRAWKIAGYHQLPAMNLACSGRGVNVPASDWIALANGDLKAENALTHLHAVFSQGALLGSLVDPSHYIGDVLSYRFEQISQHLATALVTAQSAESQNPNATEMAVSAHGIACAANLLAHQYTLIATNVPFLARGKQVRGLRDFCASEYPDSKGGLATVLLERCLKLTTPGGTIAFVLPQNWLHSASYQSLRKKLLSAESWRLVATLGTSAFQTPMWDFNVQLLVMSRMADEYNILRGVDVSHGRRDTEKAKLIVDCSIVSIEQKWQLQNPDTLVTLQLDRSNLPLLRFSADASHGQGSFDSPRFSINFWEIPAFDNGWEPQQSAPTRTSLFAGCKHAFRWEQGSGALAELMRAKNADGYSSAKWKAGVCQWGKLGVLVGRMGDCPCSLYLGCAFDENATVIIPHSPDEISATWCFLASAEFRTLVRSIDQNICISCQSPVKVRFDRDRWRLRATETYPDGLPAPNSPDPTEWVFDGSPATEMHSMHVAVARVAGYRWPRQHGRAVAFCDSVAMDGLESHSDSAGVVCLPPIGGETRAVERIRGMLVDAFGEAWSTNKEHELLTAAGYSRKTMEEWLRDGFFEQHCALFHQRPFIWQIWDGRKDGFSALVNYHKLAAPNEQGRHLLQKLTYSYLGQWIQQQRHDQNAGVEGADGRAAAAEHLLGELEKIIEGEPPYDIFVRWKPLHEQPIGWNPDINDGVRVNIRPFMAAKPLNARGKNACILRAMPKIKWDKDRGKNHRETARIIHGFGAGMASQWIFSEAATLMATGGTTCTIHVQRKRMRGIVPTEADSGFFRQKSPPRSRKRSKKSPSSCGARC
ncbi:MAG: BREX-1 system adenine-specific DNA-methyltransferase PglX, partial [Polyangiaceae bacterium]|nr:BREX-1 system adenine-specific DNA-methyltransferase PglX [Polyangiaceae bacterium]